AARADARRAREFAVAESRAGDPAQRQSVGLFTGRAREARAAVWHDLVSRRVLGSGLAVLLDEAGPVRVRLLLVARRVLLELRAEVFVREHEELTLVDHVDVR